MSHDPLRRYGMDHDRYAWSMLEDRPPIQWPGAAALAVCLVVPLQHYAIQQNDKPYKVPGGMQTTYPDLRHASLRDYGNRVGIYRVLEVLDSHPLRPAFALNSDLLDHYPALVRRIVARGDEIVGHGARMDALHHAGLSTDAERAMITTPLQRLTQLTGQRPTAWWSPVRGQSPHTPDLLAAAGIRVSLDWLNDELPYPQNTSAGTLWNLPLSLELEDRFVLMNNLHSEQSYAEQVCDAIDFLLEEAAQLNAGRLLTLVVHPWLLGQPHRIAELDHVLTHLRMASKDQLYVAGPTAIADWVAAQHGPHFAERKA
jgi:allantoinase